jgi:hypothetical protein
MDEPEKETLGDAGKAETNPSPDEEKGNPAASNTTRNLIIIALIAVIVLVALVYVPNLLKKHQLQSDSYNNFQFVKQPDGFWYTVVNKGNQPYQLPFYYHPRQLEDIVVDNTVRDKFFGLKDNEGSIFITLDPGSTDNKIVIAGVEVARITGERFGLLDVPTRSAFTRPPTDSSVNTETPVIGCKDANPKNLVVWIVVTNKNLVSSNGYCVILEAKSYNDTVKVADRLVYNLLGIMK